MNRANATHRRRASSQIPSLRPRPIGRCAFHRAWILTVFPYVTCMPPIRCQSPVNAPSILLCLNLLSMSIHRVIGALTTRDHGRRLHGHSRSQWTVSQIPPRSQEPPPFRRTTSSNHPKGLIRRQLAINRPQQMVGNLLSWEIPSFQYPVGFGTRRLWIVREPVGPSACNRLAAAGSWQPSVSRSR